MQLRSLTLKDKPVFDEFLARERHELCVYAFENIYPWQGLFDIRWQLIRGALCVFFKDRIGAFLYCEPLGNNRDPRVVAEAFSAMDALNKNRAFSRIENVEEGSRPFYEDLGYLCREKSCDYVYSRQALVALAGSRFKSKRAPFNYFVKHYRFAYLPYARQHRRACLRLYDAWSAQRGRGVKDRSYLAMLKESGVSLTALLEGYGRTGVTGRVVEVDGEVKAFTFGFKLNRDTFCISYEVADLSVKGLAQFIFRRFCSELEEYAFINVMDDSGLENLRKVKLSYRPLRLVTAYNVTRDNAV